MAAEALQQGGAALQGGEQVEAREGAAGALALAVLQADHKRRAGVLLRQTGGHDAHHPLVPLLPGQHQGVPLRPGLGHGLALGIDLRLNGLPLPVEVAQGPGEFLPPGRIVREKQFPSQGGAPHPPGGIDAGGQGVADGRGGKGPLIQPRLVEQGPQPRPPGAAQGLQPQAHNGAVLSRQAHDIGHRADGRQIGVALQQLVPPGRAAQGQHQLEGHPHPGQALEGIGAAGPAGVHHRRGGGQGGLALVVVGDHQLHPQGGGAGRLLHGGDAAVHRDDEAHPLAPEGGHRLPVEAVALLHPVGDIGDHRPPLPAEEVGEQAGGGDAVHVVVAVDRDVFPRRQRPAHPRRGPVHVLHEKRVQELAPAGVQKGAGLLRGVQPAGAEGQRRQGRHPRRLHGGPRLRGTGRPVPLLVFHGRMPPSLKITLYYIKLSAL